MAQITYKINVLNDTLKAPSFLTEVENRIRVIKENKHKEILGNNLNRSYDYLAEKDLLKADYFISEFDLIRREESKLPFSICVFILFVLGPVLYDFLTKQKKNK